MGTKIPSGRGVATGPGRILTAERTSGPLTGLRVVEIASMAPGSFAAMMLADLGAEVLRVDRASVVDEGQPPDFLLHRGRRYCRRPSHGSRASGSRIAPGQRAEVLIEGLLRPGELNGLESGLIDAGRSIQGSCTVA